MPKIVLKYNPYIKETEVTFNGKSPGLNCLVENYRESFLQEWLTRLPDIFRNEMNGYDFDIDFIGTKLDFKNLTKTFKDAGEKYKCIHLFHKEALDDRKTKAKKLEDFYKWVESNSNKLFDMKPMLDKLAALAQAPIECLFISHLNAEQIKKDFPFPPKWIKVDSFFDPNRLKNEDLKNLILKNIDLILD